MGPGGVLAEVHQLMVIHTNVNYGYYATSTRCTMLVGVARRHITALATRWMRWDSTPSPHTRTAKVKVSLGCSCILLLLQLASTISSFTTKSICPKQSGVFRLLRCGCPIRTLRLKHGSKWRTNICTNPEAFVYTQFIRLRWPLC